MVWEPDRYLRFAAERAAPFEDCLRLITVAHRPGLRIVDLGCGTGALTRQLADAYPAAEVLGLDSSPEMLDRADALARPGLVFARRTIESFIDGAEVYDLVFSHAALHWVPDHRRLVPRLFARVAPGGQLVVQVPANHDHPTHALVRELAGEEPFASALGGLVRATTVLPADAYAELLHAAGGRDLVVMEKIYPHVLEDAAALVEWVRGTTLVPYLDRLPPALHAPLLARYRARLEARWPEGPLFYGFRRLLLAAGRPG